MDKKIKFLVTNLQWDTDGEEVDLPATVSLDVDEDELAGRDTAVCLGDILSELYGYCHRGFSYTMVEDGGAVPSYDVTFSPMVNVRMDGIADPYNLTDDEVQSISLAAATKLLQQLSPEELAESISGIRLYSVGGRTDLHKTVWPASRQQGVYYQPENDSGVPSGMMSFMAFRTPEEACEWLVNHGHDPSLWIINRYEDDDIEGVTIIDRHGAVVEVFE